MSSQKLLRARFLEWPEHQPTPGSYANGHVQHVSVRLSLISIMSVQTATMLRGELLQSLRLYRARTVDMYLMVDGRLTKRQQKGADYRISEFCDLLLVLLPAATIFNIGVYEEPGVIWNHKGEWVTMLLHSLDRHATRLQLEIHVPLSIPILEAHPLANLTSFTASKMSSDEMAQVVVLNSQSLRVLDLADVGIRFLWTMVSSNGASISYPRLTKLAVQSFDHNSSWHRPFTTTGCPFPALRHLRITAGYPFSDDTLFRGNHETLESLYVTYGIQAFKVLNEHLAANGAMLCSLRHLTIIHMRWEVGNDGESMLAATDPIIQRAPSLQSLSVFLSDEYHCTFNVAAWLGCIPKQLRVLSVIGKDLNINEFIMLVRELPSLESLTCGLELDDETDTRQLGDISATNTPLNARFRCWSHIINCRSSNRNSNQWNKILTGLCPNFAYCKPERAP